MPGSSKPKARLSDIEVKELSVVDRAANKRTFLIMKDADGAADQPISAEPAGEPTGTAPAQPPSDVPPPVDDQASNVAPAGTDPTGAEPAGQQPAIDSATVNAEVPASEAVTVPLTPEQAAAVAATPSQPGEVDKATWSTKFVNDLPDSSFLYIESGGKKDAGGKTTPRSLRHFPVKDADGKVDLPHVKNALSRIPQSDLPDSVKKKCTAAAQKLLDAAKKAEKSDGGEDVEKRGAKMRKERLGRFSSAIDELDKIRKELQALEDEVETTDKSASDGVIEPAPAAEPNPLEPKVSDLTTQVAQLTAQVDELTKSLATERATSAKQASLLKTAQIAPPKNSSAPEGGGAPTTRFAWPVDLNDKRAAS